MVMKTRLIAPLLAILLSGCITEKDEENIGIQRGDALPDFSVDLSDGRRISAVDMKGKRVLIEFFNTSCGDCRRGLPSVDSVYLEYKDNPDVLVMAIARDERAAKIESYWESNGLSIPYSAQDDRRIYNLFATTGIPRTFISNEQGMVVATFGDADLPTFSMLRDALTSPSD